MYPPTYFNQPTPACARKPVTESETENARSAIRQKLVAAIQEVVSERRITHTEASFESRVGRTVMTAILNNNLSKISTDRLIRIAHRLGLKIELKVFLG